MGCGMMCLGQLASSLAAGGFGGGMAWRMETGLLSPFPCLLLHPVPLFMLYPLGR